MIRLPRFTVMVCATALAMLGDQKSSGVDPFPNDYERAFTEGLDFAVHISHDAEILNADLDYFDGGTSGVVIVLGSFGRAFVMLPANLPGPKHRDGPWVIISAFEGLVPQVEVAKGSELAKRLRQYFKIARRPSDPKVLKRIQAIARNLDELSPSGKEGDNDALPVGKAQERLK